MLIVDVAVAVAVGNVFSRLLLNFLLNSLNLDFHGIRRCLEPYLMLYRENGKVFSCVFVVEIVLFDVGFKCHEHVESMQFSSDS